MTSSVSSPRLPSVGTAKTPPVAPKPLMKPLVVAAPAVAPSKSVIVNLSPAAASLTTTAQPQALAADPPLLTFDAKRTSAYEENATTGTVTQASGSTGLATIALTAGKSYKFDSGYSCTGAAPKFKFSLLDSNGKLVASSATPNVALQVKITKSDTYTLKIEASNATTKLANTATLTSYALNVHEMKPSLGTSSGDKNVDALMSGSWWHDLGVVAAKSTDAAKVISPSLTSLTDASARHTVTYSFLDNASYSFLSTKDKAGFAALDTDQKAVVKKAFDYLSTLINVTFTEANAVTGSDIAFGANDQTASAGYALYPNANGDVPSVMMLDISNNPGNSGANLGTLGSYGWETLVHEIGHTMGLKHPGNYNAGGGSTPGPYLPSTTDNRRMAIMSYNNPTDGYAITASVPDSTHYSYSAKAVNPSTYGVYDIAALQYLYGANTKTETSEALVLDNAYQSIQTLWAPKGITVDASATTRSSLFDLRGGAYSSVAIRTKTDATNAVTAALKAGGMSDAVAALSAGKIMGSGKSPVPTATGGSTAVLNSSLFYSGKNDLGLAYGSQMVSVTGGSSADSFYVSSYSATLNGGAGTDTVYLTGSAADWALNGSVLTGKSGTLDASAASLTLSNKKTSAVLTLKAIEAYAFYNDATLSTLHA